MTLSMIENDTITVEDEDALLALPVGTIVEDRDGDQYIRTEDEFADWYGTYQDDEVDADYIAHYQPVTVVNPEILGEFKAREFEVGQRVRIVGADIDNPASRHNLHIGSEATVLALNAGEGVYDAELIQVEGDSNDWGIDGLTQLVLPHDIEAIEVEGRDFEVGDRVMIDYMPGSMWNGPGTVAVVEAETGFIHVRSDEAGMTGAFARSEVSFLVEEQVEDDLAEWERELLAYAAEVVARPEVGEFVVIANGHGLGYEGIRGQVIDPFDLDARFFDLETKVYIKPIDPRPSGNHSPFLWPVDSLEVIDYTAVQVGDRVELLHRLTSGRQAGELATVVKVWEHEEAKRQGYGADRVLRVAVEFDEDPEDYLGTDLYASRFKLSSEPKIVRPVAEFEDFNEAGATVEDRQALDSLGDGTVLTHPYEPTMLIAKRGDYWVNVLSHHVSDWTDSMHNWLDNCDEVFIVAYVPA